jgi:hypothetical protein
MSKNMRELSERELDMVSGGGQSAAFGATPSNPGCFTRIITITNNGFTGPMGYGDLSGSFSPGLPCSSGGPSELGPGETGGYPDDGAGTPYYYYYY